MSAPRAPERVAPQNAPRFVQPQQAPRVEARPSTPQRFEAPRYTAPQRYEAPRYTAPQRYEAPRYAAPRYDSRFGRDDSRFGRPSYRPYYTFRSHFSIGIGLFLGYPVAFPSWYSYPYDAYGYGGISAGPAYGAYGGVSLDIEPDNAELYVDGNYVGLVADFAPTEPPLTLGAGRHRLELRAPGYLTQVFDITVLGGQVLPLQGTLRYR